MSIYIIADLHLADEYPQRHESFLNFCELITRRKTLLYILGDLFDAWLGDDMMSEKSKQIANALLTIKKSGGKVFFQAGNRDFLLGERFIEISGCEQLKEEEILQIYNKRIFVAHGDSMCIADKEFYDIRKNSRTLEWKKNFLSKSKEERIALRDQYFIQSNEHQLRNDEKTLSIPRAYIKEIFVKHDVDILIHGHLHRPDEFEINLQNKKRQCICLGDWGNQHKAWFVIMNENGIAKLHSCPLNNIESLKNI